MKSTVTAKHQTTIPKEVREKLGISVHDALEWVVDDGKVIVFPVHNEFFRHRGSVKVGTGDVAADIETARKRRLEKYR